MAENHSHHSPATAKAQTPESAFTPSRVLAGAMLGAGALGLGLMLAPHVLPTLGVTSVEVAEEAALMIHNSASGMAGSMNNMLALIPAVGGKLAEGGLFTATVSGVLGVGGVLLGNFMEKRESNEKRLKWGTLLKYGAMATSALIALPTILTSIGTGIVYIGMALSQAGVISTATSNSIIANVYKTIGSIGGTYSHDLLGLSGLAGVVPHFIGCGMPLAPAALSLGLTKKNEQEKTAAAENKTRLYKPVNKQLHLDDPNHMLTQEQQQMVEAYNNAPASRKPILQKWFRDKGFNPDFHADGTMHLYQHTTGMAR